MMFYVKNTLLQARKMKTHGINLNQIMVVLTHGLTLNSLWPEFLKNLQNYKKKYRDVKTDIHFWF